ncbi:Mu transposase C-terminal domain-containing protein (plasmid) [Rhizobium gallicum]|nr:Mu transposase C-terminal domain-containing protein [Rhizobium gallicum]ULJ76174.1 Mu transposase C-terminal domain-containing protein [Rhizobium gallicum]
MTTQRAALPRFDDDPQRVLLSFLPETERKFSPQGISMFALHYYAPWLGSLIPQRDQHRQVNRLSIWNPA